MNASLTRKTPTSHYYTTSQYLPVPQISHFIILFNQSSGKYTVQSPPYSFIWLTGEIMSECTLTHRHSTSALVAISSHTMGTLTSESKWCNAICAHTCICVRFACVGSNRTFCVTMVLKWGGLNEIVVVNSCWTNNSPSKETYAPNFYSR